jgi:AcrR family transcriptional regulator
MARTPKVAEDRREQILDAAMRVFAQKGFARATNKDIAHEAGITPGLIYHYFDSKESLLSAVIETRSPLQFITNVPPQLFTLPPEQFFRFLLLQLLSLAESERFLSFARVMFSEMLHGGNASVPVASVVFPRIIEVVSKYLEQKMAAGELRRSDSKMVVQVIAGAVASFVVRRHVMQDPIAQAYTHEQIVESVLDVCLSGLLPR